MKDVKLFSSIGLKCNTFFVTDYSTSTNHCLEDKWRCLRIKFVDIITLSNDFTSNVVIMYYKIAFQCSSMHYLDLARRKKSANIASIEKQMEAFTILADTNSLRAELLTYFIIIERMFCSVLELRITFLDFYLEIVQRKQNNTYLIHSCKWEAF